jgi:hypothetical protein
MGISRYVFKNKWSQTFRITVIVLHYGFGGRGSTRDGSKANSYSCVDISSVVEPIRDVEGFQIIQKALGQETIKLIISLCRSVIIVDSSCECQPNVSLLFLFTQA